MSKINKLDLLIAIYIFCIVASELMGAKTFFLFKVGTLNLNASVAILLTPLIFLINDVITEVYGRARTRSIIKSGLIIIVLLIIFTLFATGITPSARFLASNSAYVEVFHISIRISVASLLAFTLSEFLDVLVFNKIRDRLGRKNLWLRTNASNIISLSVDTIVFFTLAFYSLNLPVGQNITFLLGLIIPYGLLKCSMSILETPFVYLGVKWLKKENSQYENNNL